MSSVNKAIIVGRLTRDPEQRTMQNGKPVVNLNVATSETWKDKNSGERKERSEFHRVVIFNENIGKVAIQYLAKGSRIYLEGSIETRKWTDQQGIEKYATEVVLRPFRGELTMLDSKPDSTKTATENYSQPAVDPADELEDQIPFSPAWVLER